MSALKKRVQRTDFRLSPQVKADVRSALGILAGSGLSLTEAAVRALMAADGKESVVKKTPLAEAVRGFIADRNRRQRRGATLEYYETNLARFLQSPFAERWQTVGRAELKKWLEELPGGYSTRHMVFRCVRALYRWAAAQNPPLVTVVPTAGLVMDDVGGEKKTVKFYPVGVCERALGRVSAKARAALAVHLFTGMRPEEVAPRFPGKERLQWEHFDFADKIVRVPAEVSKTRRPRLLEDLPTPLWEWLGLTPEAERTGPIWDGTEGNWRWHLRQALGGSKWIADGFRHTFATMCLALTKDAGAVGEWLGHEGKAGTLRNKYVGLERRANAEKFVALLPSAVPIVAKLKPGPKKSPG